VDARRYDGRHAVTADAVDGTFDPMDAAEIDAIVVLQVTADSKTAAVIV